MRTAATLLGPGLAAAVTISAMPAAAQSSGESVDQRQRLCIYRNGPGLLTGTERTTVHRVGMAENCPVTPPVSLDHMEAPPSAPLVADDLRDGVRICTYGVADNRWAFELPTSRYCPPAAGALLRRPDGSGGR